MHRYKLTLEYDGTPFWACQPQEGGLGVQDALERAITRINGSLQRTSVAGRTDRGVHALGQVAHVDLAREWSGWKLREALNAWLREEGPVAVIEAEPVGPQFHARFSCTARHYLYRIVNRRAALALDAGRVWRVPYELDIGAMQQAAGLLVGTHDFSSFRDRDCQASSPVKTLDLFGIAQVDGVTGPEIHARLSARSFLHRQVRSMMGAVAKVGRGALSLEGLSRAIEARNRAAAPDVAPAAGLYLTHVSYGETPVEGASRKQVD
jgi:tRNA pseudouridine38-40 synthase